MGFLGWLFPSMASPAEKVVRARKLVGLGEPNEARLLLEGVTGAEADEVRASALAVLVTGNLEAAEAAMVSGDQALVAEHLDLAASFGATPEQIRNARRRRGAARRPPPPPPKPSAPPEEGHDPIWSLPPDDPRLRYALLVEAWPEALQSRLLALGPEFASAVLAIDEGGAARAWEALAPFVHQDPVAHYERARAALAAGQLGLAAGELRAFGERVGHVRIGSVHSAALFAEAMIRVGRGNEALGPVRMAVDQSPNDLELRFALASLLEALEYWEDAEVAAQELCLRAGRAMGAWRMLARLRQRRGDAMAAAVALEQGLSACCSSPGKCGNQALDVEAVEMLAAIYLSRGDHPERVAELAAKLRAEGVAPTWEPQLVPA